MFSNILVGVSRRDLWPRDLARGDGTISWLAGTNIPFCIILLGTPNNCARSLGQTHPVEEVLSQFHSAPTKKVDLGILTSPDGHRIFVESAGLGLLPIFMSEMRLFEKKNRSRERLSTGYEAVHSQS